MMKMKTVRVLFLSIWISIYAILLRSSSVSAATSIPTASPTTCSGTVICCFTAKDDYLQVYLDGVDITSSIVRQPGTFASEWQRIKLMSFPEPAYSTVLAIKGTAVNGSAAASGLQLRCTSTRKPYSPWNFSTDVNTGWTSVPSSSDTLNLFPNNWYQPSYSGQTNSSIQSTASFSLGYSEGCRPPPTTSKIAAPFRQNYFTFRRYVVQDCSTRSPTTQQPSSSPTSSLPTVSPTVSAPSVSPTISGTLQPTTTGPSSSPTAPTTLQPTTMSPSVSPTAPTLQPTTAGPSASPTAPTTLQPTTVGPSVSPTAPTTLQPTTTGPSVSPTAPTTLQPTTAGPSASPTAPTTLQPTTMGPSVSPTAPTTLQPTTAGPSVSPTAPTTLQPTTAGPSVSPTAPTTLQPTTAGPSASPTAPTTSNPTTAGPSASPTAPTTLQPTTMGPSTSPTAPTTLQPTTMGPSVSPTAPTTLQPTTTGPSVSPTAPTTLQPTTAGPSTSPTAPTTSNPTSAGPSVSPTAPTTLQPTTMGPSASPTSPTTLQPTTMGPSVSPTAPTTLQPTTAGPSVSPTAPTTLQPTTAGPSVSPTAPTTLQPTTAGPSVSPTAPTTLQPTTMGPSVSPTAPTTLQPTTMGPSVSPTAPTTLQPTTMGPSVSPTAPTTLQPTTMGPSVSPTAPTTLQPTTMGPSVSPTAPTTLQPTTMGPSVSPTAPTTLQPTTMGPSVSPTAPTTLQPTTMGPSASPTAPTTLQPTTMGPSVSPTAPTTLQPTTMGPSVSPTAPTTLQPTTMVPSVSPTAPTTLQPTSFSPSATPMSPTSTLPTTGPTASPSSSSPSTSPTVATKTPSQAPTSPPSTLSPSTSPSHTPSTSSPSATPTSSIPTSSPSASPSTSKPTFGPSYSPSKAPTSKPSSSPSFAPTACSTNYMTDVMNCGRCGNVCGANQNCQAGICVGTGDIQVTINWGRAGDADLWVYPPGKQRVLNYFYNKPSVTNQYGTLDYRDGHASGVYMENAFWNANVTNQTGAQGTYIICINPLVFSPVPSVANPLPYSARVFYENKIVNFTGTITVDALANPSPQCVPNNKTTATGYYIGNITCTCCGANYLTDRNNCGRCGKVCASHATCRNGVCMGTGEIEMSLTWQRIGDLNLWVYPPSLFTSVGWDTRRGPSANTAYGVLDYTNTPATTFGPDHVYWNSNFTGQAVPTGCYSICVESLSGFSPSVSPTAPVNFSVALQVNGQSQTFTGSLTADGPISAQCVPRGFSPGNEFQHGMLVGIFGYPNMVLDFQTDNYNCGACNVMCPSSTICRGGTCVVSGDLRVTLTQWNRVGDMDLIVFPPDSLTRVAWDDPGARAETDWGRMDTVSDQYGPENVFWNSTRVISGSTYATPTGEYTVCIDTYNFIPGVSTLNPVNFTVEIANATYTKTIRASIDFDTYNNASVECKPVGAAVGNEFNRGYLVTKFTYPYI